MGNNYEEYDADQIQIWRWRPESFLKKVWEKPLRCRECRHRNTAGGAARLLLWIF